MRRLQEGAVKQFGRNFASWCPLLTSLTTGSRLLHWLLAPRSSLEQLGEQFLMAAAQDESAEPGLSQRPRRHS